MRSGGSHRILRQRTGSYVSLSDNWNLRRPICWHPRSGTDSWPKTFRISSGPSASRTMRFEYVSPSVESIRGFTPEEAMRLSLEEILTPQSLEIVAGPLPRNWQEKGTVGVDPDRHRTIEVQQLCKDGSYAWAEATMSFIRNEEGRPVGVLGVTRDISERKRMEEELRRSRDDLELRVSERTKELKRQAELLDLSHDAIVVREMDGVIAFWNKGAEEMYGWTKEESKGKIMRDLLQTQFPTPRDEIMAEIMQEGRWEGELTQTRKDGKKINVLSRWALQKDEEGKPTGVMHINHDITQRLKLEEQLRQAQKMEAIGTLTGGIAHDFNNILGAIVINSELALFDLPEGSGIRT